MVNNKKLSLRCRKFLLKYNISTKILPEAYTWHFAGKWSHINELKKLNLSKILRKSENKLSRAVSIPISIKFTKKQILNIKTAIQEALE